VDATERTKRVIFSVALATLWVLGSAQSLTDSAVRPLLRGRSAMANALIVQKNSLPQSQKGHRAAQYVRMSTDLQRYSIENQAAVIAAYAELHGMSIVRTYRDEGISGLKIKNRMGLTELIEDVRCGSADFSHVLVFDVSRWGRFQDVDESAYYEFICKQAGIQIAYCAEQFVNDGSLLSNIVKNIKRVMAAEYSRELSFKVLAGATRLATLGFKMGGKPGYGLQRILVDEKSEAKGILRAGERKALISDRVKVGPVNADQANVVRWIFEQFLGGKSQSAIMRELNQRGIEANSGRAWRKNAVGALLRNEAYIGNLVYNRYSEKLGAKRTLNPANLWVRSEGCVEPIIDRDVFQRAQKILDVQRINISEEEMLVRLRKFLMKKGKLSFRIINAAPGLPSGSTYLAHFGTLRNLYRLIGYTNNQHYWDGLNAYKRWVNLNFENATLLCDAFVKAGGRATFDPSIQCLRANDAVNICFGVAKWRRYEHRGLRWSLRTLRHRPPGWFVAIRLGKNNETVLDYILLPSTSLGKDWLWISEEGRAALSIERFETFEELARSLVRRVSKAKHNTSML
jgi:DNA invertase Pin-like site-specific DNA recombinase